MTPLRFYLDEDLMDRDLVRVLRARGVDVTTALAGGGCQCHEPSMSANAGIQRAGAGFFLDPDHLLYTGEQSRRIECCRYMIASVVSVHAVPIRLMEKQWAHIVENHDYMAGCIDAVLETVSDPDMIVQGWTDELIAMKHYAKTVISEKDAVVVYKEAQGDGFVITAFMTSSPERIRKRGVIWRK